MIDLETEELLPVKDIPKQSPGRRIHIATAWRWVLDGCRGVKLETVLVGGRRYTSAEAIQRFVEATTAAAAGEPIPTRSAKQRAKAIAAAERELDAMGA